MNENYWKKQVKQLKQQLNDALDGNTTRLNNLREKVAHLQDEISVLRLQRDALLVENQKLQEVIGEQEGNGAVPQNDLRVQDEVPDEEGSEARATEALEEGAA